MEDKIIKDYSGNEIKVGDRVILGKGKDVCFGKIAKCDPLNEWGWTWIIIKTEDSNTSIDRRSNQVIKIDDNYGR